MEIYFKLKKDEEIVMTENDVVVRAGDKKIVANIIVTTKRMVLLQDVNKELLATTYLNNQGISVMPSYEVTYEMAFSDVHNISFRDNCNVLKLKDNNILEVYCSNFVKNIK